MAFTKDEIGALSNAFEEAIRTLKVGWIWDESYSIKIPAIQNRGEAIKKYKDVLMENGEDTI